MAVKLSLIIAYIKIILVMIPSHAEFSLEDVFFSLILLGVIFFYYRYSIYDLLDDMPRTFGYLLIWGLIAVAALLIFRSLN